MMEPLSSDHKTTVVRLLRRPTTNQDGGESTTNTFTAPESNPNTLETASSSAELRNKIGAPIIRHVPSTRSNVASNQRQRNVEKTRIAGQTGFHEKTESSSKPVSVPREEVPLPDFSSDSQWPSIGGTDESGRSQGAWSSVLATSQEGKGWSAIVKSAPLGKGLIVRRKDPTKAAEGVNDDANEGGSEGEDMWAAGGSQKQKRKRNKKKKSSSGQEPPQEKKLDKPPQLDILAFAKQSPVRPVLNRKDTKPPAKDVSATSRNMLDSTAPTTRRGKERETPKAKKPTYLRKVIEKEKAAKKELQKAGLKIPPDFDVMKRLATDQSDHSNVPAATDNEVDANTGQESLTTPTDISEATPTDQSLEATPTDQPIQATPTDQAIEATPTNDVIPAPSITPSSTTTVPETGSVVQKRPIHGRRFREYCSHVVTDEINGAAETLLLDLVRFQDRVYHRDPNKAKSKRRYVCGLREVHKHLEVGKLKCVIVPPNLDHIQSTGGIDERITAILSLCQSKEVPVVYAMSRRKLAVILKKKFKIGCVGIFSYDGAEGHYRRLRKLVEEATELYGRLAHPVAPTEEETPPTTNDPLSLESCSEEEDSIPEPKTGNVTQTTTADGLWDKYFPKKEEKGVSSHTDDTPTDPHTNQEVRHFNNDVTDNSIEDDITGSKQVARERIPVQESGTTGTTSSSLVLTGQRHVILQADAPVFSPRKTVFQLNINAAEFIPS